MTFGLAAESKLTRGFPAFAGEEVRFLQREEIHPSQAGANLVPKPRSQEFYVNLGSKEAQRTWTH
jgi:hypothetical protein